jgi:hypothetical protein
MPKVGMALMTRHIGFIGVASLLGWARMGQTAPQGGLDQTELDNEHDSWT